MRNIEDTISFVIRKATINIRLLCLEEKEKIIFLCRSFATQSKNKIASECRE